MTLPKLALIPSGYKASKVYSALPTNGDGDFTFSRTSNATRVNKDGLIETVDSNVPRLDYSDSSCPSLLLEPQRTNNARFSETPEAVSWTDPLGEWTLLTETTISPRGDQTRVFDLEDSSGSLIRCQDFSVAAGTYTISFYIKDIGGNFTGGIIDLGDTGAGDTTPSLSTVGSEWVRVSRTITITSTKNFLDLQLNFTGSTNKVGIWGLQLEEGNYATSYIPTEGGAETRTVETSKLENFANIPTNYPFTVFVDMDVISDQIGFGFSIIDISTPNIYFSIGYSEVGSTNKFRFTNRSQGTSYSFNTTLTYGTGRYKIAIKFISSTNFKAFINGIEVADYTHTSSIFNTNINDILLGQLRAVSDTGTRNNVNNFMIFNEELSDAELISLTS